jgi:hypothetical protein
VTAAKQTKKQPIIRRTTYYIQLKMKRQPKQVNENQLLQ